MNKEWRNGRRRRVKGERGRGTLTKEKTPALGMIQPDSQLVIKMLPEVRPQTIEPFMMGTISSGTTVLTDEDDLNHRLPEGGYRHQTVCHSQGEMCEMRIGMAAAGFM